MVWKSKKRKVNTEEYREFIKKHFPYSSVVKESQIENIYKRVCENNIITNTFEINIDNFNKEVSDVFLSRYLYFFNKLLLQVPTNDIDSINYYIRSISENLLKFIYAINSDKEFKYINTISFRHLNEELKPLVCRSNYKVEVDLLFDIYGKNSNLLHKKTSTEKQCLNYIENIITENVIDIKSLDKKLIQIINIYEKVVSNHFEFKQKDMDSKSCISLKRILTTSRYKVLVNNLYKEI